MSIADFPPLSEIEQEVLDKLDQPDGESGLPAFRKQEWVRAFNRAYQYIWGRLSDLDKDWGMKIADIAVSSGTRIVDLSSLKDMRGLRHLVELSGGEEGNEWRVSQFSDIGILDNAFVYQKDQKRLYLLRTPTSSTTFRLVYNYIPPTLAHGYVVSASSVQTQLASYEASTDDALVGQTIYIYGDSPASGLYKTVTVYDGDTQTCTHSAWGVPPSIGDKYTTIPQLPIGARDAFVYDVCAYLADKHADERLNVFMIEREKHLDALQREVVRHERTEAITVRDPLGFSRCDDPVDYYW